MILLRPLFDIRMRHDFDRRVQFARYEKKRRKYYWLMRSQFLSKGFRIPLHFTMKRHFDQASHSSKIRSFCILTGRSRSVYRKFHISRMAFRHLGSFGYLLGIRRSSW
jgi:ribosomal protein S14